MPIKLLDRRTSHSARIPHGNSRPSHHTLAKRCLCPQRDDSWSSWRPEGGKAPRLYQQELLDLALQRNVIVFLNTGAGKTLVALMLISQQLEELRRTGKKAIFTAPTVPLVLQQGAEVQKHADKDAGILHGQMGVDNWSSQKWQEMIAQHSVFVTVPQVLLDMLSAGYLRMENIGLLIVDECHHTRGKAPGALVMKQFYFDPDLAPEQRPKVFGMTASPLNKKSKNSDVVDKDVQLLQHILDCRIVTVLNRSEVEEHAPTAELSWLTFEPDREGSPIDFTSKVIGACAMLVRMAAERCTLRENLHAFTLLLAQFPALKDTGDLLHLDKEDGSSVLESMARMLDKVANCTKDLGPWCGAAALTEILKPKNTDSMDYKAMQYSKASSAATANTPLPIGVTNDEILLDLQRIRELTELLKSHMPQDVWLGVPENDLELAVLRFALLRTFVALMTVLMPLQEGHESRRAALEAEFGQAVYCTSEYQREGCGVIVQKLMQFVVGNDFVDQCLGLAHPSALGLPSPLVTDKVTQAVLYLKADKAQFGECGTVDDLPPPPADNGREEVMAWSCLVFVERKITAVALHCLIRQLGQYDSDIGSQLTCGMLIAFNGSGSAESMSSKAQQKVLEDFRRGTYSVIVASSVAEEGLDLRRCQLVLRFDLPTNERSFVQSRGRARMKNSRMVMMVDVAASDMREKVQLQFNEYEEAMRMMAQEQALNAASSDDEDDFELPQTLPENIYRVPSTGATVTIESAKPLLFHYTQKLPSDRYHAPRPRFRTLQVDDPPGWVRSTVYLPNNAALHSAEGRAQSRKAEARMSACLSACIELHQKGALNDNLVPVVECPDMSAYGQIAGEEDDSPSQSSVLVTKLRAIPKLLTPSAPSDVSTTSSKAPAMSINIYSFQFTPETLQSLPPDHPLRLTSRWCVLLQKKLPGLPSFPVWWFDGQINHEADMHVQHMGHTWLEQDKLAMLQRAHQHVLSLFIKGQASEPYQPGMAMIPDATWGSASHGIWYILAPQLPATSNNIAIDWTLAQQLAQGAQPLTQLVDLQDFTHPGETHRAAKEKLALAVSGKVLRTTYNNMLYLGSDVSPELTLSSPFPKEGLALRKRKKPEPEQPAEQVYDTYEDYYDKKHGVQGLVSSQPLLRAKMREFVTELRGVEYCMRPYRPAKSKAADAEPAAGVTDHGNTEQDQGHIHSQVSSRPDNHSRNTDQESAMMMISPRGEVSTQPSMHYSTAGTPRGGMHGDLVNGRLEAEMAEAEFEAEIEAEFEAEIEAKLERGVDMDAEFEAEAELEVEFEEAELDGRLKEEVELVPELCCVLPMPPVLWKSVRCMLQLVHRMEWLVAAEEVATTKLMPSGSRFSVSALAVLHCITTTGARDHHSMERYELLGDTVLKFCTAAHLYHQFEKEDEELLTARKNYIVSNKRLAKLGRSLGLHNYLLTYAFDLNGWRPPGSTKMPPTPPPAQVGVKRVADMMEALLGAVYHAHGLAASIEFLVHMRLLPEELKQHVNSPQTQSQAHQEYQQELLRIASVEGAGLALPPILPTPGCDFQEAVLATGQHFKRESSGLLREALTHASWPMPIPPCYQRLEFLGDAALDLVVTYLTFLIYPAATPGMLTEVRKATVNNDRLAYCSAKLSLHTRLLHFSTQLQSDIGDYLRDLGDMEDDDSDDEAAGSNVKEVSGPPTQTLASTNPTGISSQTGVVAELASNGVPQGADPKATPHGSRKVRASARGTSTHDNDWTAVLRARNAPPIRDAPKVMADVIESVLAVVLLDSGMDLVAVAQACYRMGLLQGLTFILQGFTDCCIGVHDVLA